MQPRSPDKQAKEQYFEYMIFLGFLAQVTLWATGRLVPEVLPSRITCPFGTPLAE